MACPDSRDVAQMRLEFFYLRSATSVRVLRRRRPLPTSPFRNHLIHSLPDSVDCMDPMASPGMVQPPHSQVSNVQRRGLRKGTHSCWECKRRKTKCVFGPVANATACNACRRRGVRCVSQTLPEEAALAVDKMYRAGDYVTMLPLPHAGNRSTAHDPRTPATLSEKDTGRESMSSEPLQAPDLYQTPDSGVYLPASHGKHGRLSSFLHKSLPSPEDHERICKASPVPTVLAHEVLTTPYTSLAQDNLKQPERLLAVPGPDQHPILIARHMLLLASVLQHLHPSVHKAIQGLSESPRAMSERLAECAVSHVTTKDDLLGSIEGLECIMIESVYQANLGNLRRSWVACRRAVSTAQLMGLDRSDHRAQYTVLDTQTKYDPRSMWFRIMFLDRFLCLMLGLPQACADRSATFDAMPKNLSMEERLEQIHCVVASRILERNGSDPSSHDYAITQALDLELQRAARSLLGKWWLIPKLDVGTNTSRSLYCSTGRIFAQVLHFNLLNQLHLPYMLRSSSTERKHEYSRITCVNASREVLSRFIALRNFNEIDSSCRIVDFLALMAAITLLLAHLDSHATEVENLLAHQYQSDRAVIEQVEESMRDVNRLNSDALSAHSAKLLRRLLAIDVEPQNGCSPPTRRLSLDEAPADQDADAVVSISIPYFGTVRVARQSVRMEGHGSQSTAAATSFQSQSQAADSSSTTNAEMLRAEAIARLGTNDHAMTPVRTGGDCAIPAMLNASTASQSIPGSAASGAGDFATQYGPQQQNNILDPVLPYGDYPGMTAGSEDWAFQGVDLAFFDTLMRGAGNDVSWGADWSADAEMSMNAPQLGQYANG